MNRYGRLPGEADSAKSASMSVRKLGSLPHLGQLNPFNRRRSSGQSENTLPVTTDRVAFEAPTLPIPTGMVHLLDENGTNASIFDERLFPANLLADQTARKARRGSYIPVSAKASGQLPKSRTSSNLPVAAKTRGFSYNPKAKPSPAQIPSKIPPPSTSKKDRTGCLGSAKKGILRPGKPQSPSQSDTEPLLASDVTTSSTLETSRAATFEKNVSLSLVAQASEDKANNEEAEAFQAGLDQRNSGWSTYSMNSTGAVRWSRGSQYRVSIGSENDPLYFSEDSVESSLPTQPHPLSHVGAGLELGVKTPQASPIKERAFSRPLSPSTFMQRHNSQPVLQTVSNGSRASYGAGITQHKLLGTRQPPTPLPAPVAITPVKALAVLGETRSTIDIGNMGSAQKSNTTEMTSLVSSQVADFDDSIVDLESDLNPSDPLTTLNLGKHCDHEFELNAQPHRYWCGRLSRVLDDLRNQYFAHVLDHPMHSDPEEDILRMRQALRTLHSMCATEEAVESLRVSEDYLPSSIPSNDTSSPTREPFSPLFTFFPSLILTLQAQPASQSANTTSQYFYEKYQQGTKSIYRRAGDHEAVVQQISWEEISGTSGLKNKKTRRSSGDKRKGRGFFGTDESYYADVSSRKSSFIDRIKSLGKERRNRKSG